MPAKKDFTQVAFDVVRRATGEAPPPVAETAKQAAGRKGGLKGGAKRASVLTPEERADIAKRAALKRWEKRATAPAEDGSGALPRKAKVSL